MKPTASPPAPLCTGRVRRGLLLGSVPTAPEGRCSWAVGGNGTAGTLQKETGNKQDEEEILGSCAARGWEGELPGSPAGCSQGFSEGSWF